MLDRETPLDIHELAKQPASTRRRISSPLTLGALILVMLGTSLSLVGCGGSAPAPPPEPRPTERTESFLIDPMAALPFEPSAVLGQRIGQAWRALRAGGPTASAREEAVAVLAIDDAFAPASLLLAQVALAEGRAGVALEMLRPIAEAWPSYDAAHEVLAFAAQATGDLVLAYDALGRLPREGDVPSRRERLRPRVVEVLGNRFDTALERGRLMEAEDALARLMAVRDEADPDRLDAEAEAILAERSWNLASALGDETVERAVLERLVAADPDRRDAVERLAELEITAGELRRGLARLEPLLELHPDDADLAMRVERAKFRWRLENFPPDVRALASKPELSRAELSALIYWFLPEVRYAPLDRPPVATDILDHDRQAEIVRVLNASLMSIDPAVHRFHPERSAIRGDLIAALLRLDGLSSAVPACLGDVEPMRLRSTSATTCDFALRCGLIADAGDCLPAARISGDEALELFRANFATLAAEQNAS